MEKSPLMHMLSKATWVITALASMHVGAMAVFQYNAFMYLPESMAFLFMPIHWLYLLSGVYSLVAFFISSSSCCDK